MKIYYITRFSIYDPTFKGLKSTKSPNYKNLLFSPKRMDIKFQYFQLATLPSIKQQTHKDWEWHIYTSPELPESYKQQLKSLKDTRIKIFFVHTMKEFFEKTKTYPYVSPYATVRIDDDDGLSIHHAQLLQQYQHLKKHIITFPYGMNCRIKHGELKLGSNVIHNHIALGLTAIEMNIYSTGDHSTIHQRYNIIYDKTPKMYLVSCYPSSDSKRKFF